MKILFTKVKRHLRRHSKKYWVVIFILLTSLLVFIIYYFNNLYLEQFKGNISSNSKDFSDYGSYIGGSIGPYITLYSVIILYMTLHQQRKANEKQNLDSQIDKFESRFMMMLKLHRDNVTEMKIIKINSSDNPIEGRNVFVSIFEEWGIILGTVMREIFSNEQSFEKEAINISYQCLFYGLKENYFKIYIDNIDIVKKIREAKYYQKNLDDYESAHGYKPFDGHQNLLGHYFRHLWQAINYIDSFNIFDDTSKNEDEKLKYAKILRGQMSNHEQALLTLNAISELGASAWMTKGPKKNDKGEAIGLLEYYKLIKNIPYNFMKYKVRDSSDKYETVYIDIKKYFDLIFEWEERETSFNKIY